MRTDPPRDQDRPRQAVVILTLIVLFLPGGARADVVHLDDGSIIQGSVLEVIPGETLKIQTADGSVYVYGMDEVTRVMKAVTEVPVVKLQMEPTLRRKDPMVAFGLSWVVPGGGQFYNGHTAKGLGHLGTFVVGAWMFGPAWDGKYRFTKKMRVDTGAALMLGSLLASLVDAPVSALRINRKLEELKLSVAPTGARLALRF